MRKSEAVASFMAGGFGHVFSAGGEHPGWRVTAPVEAVDIGNASRPLSALQNPSPLGLLSSQQRESPIADHWLWFFVMPQCQG